MKLHKLHKLKEVKHYEKNSSTTYFCPSALEVPNGLLGLTTVVVVFCWSTFDDEFVCNNELFVVVFGLLVFEVGFDVNRALRAANNARIGSTGAGALAVLVVPNGLAVKFLSMVNINGDNCKYN